MYHHILLATDFSPLTERANKLASELAKNFNAKLTIIHVVEPVPTYGYPNVTEIEIPYIEAAKQELQSLCKKLKVSEEDQLLKVGSVKTQILDVAKELKVDLIILGSHGRHGLSRLLGSSASGVVHGATCDVLTVHS